jgi:enoyl-[acyl-carrier protein] reductase I
MPDALRPILLGQRALVAGIANDQSIAYGCASAFRRLGAELAVTYLNERARTHVQPLADALGAALVLPLDVSVPGHLEAVFDAIAREWGRLDIVVHSIAFAPKRDLQGGLLDCSAEGFRIAMDVSCHSFVRMAKLAAPLMTAGGTMLAMTYHGAQKGIRVHAVSPGPLKTRAASGLKDFDVLLNQAMQRAPVGALVDIEDVGFTCAYLATPFARRLTGTTMYVDGGVNIMA